MSFWTDLINCTQECPIPEPPVVLECGMYLFPRDGDVGVGFGSPNYGDERGHVAVVQYTFDIGFGYESYSDSVNHENQISGMPVPGLFIQGSALPDNAEGLLVVPAGATVKVIKGWAYTGVGGCDYVFGSEFEPFNAGPTIATAGDCSGRVLLPDISNPSAAGYFEGEYEITYATGLIWVQRGFQPSRQEPIFLTMHDLGVLFPGLDLTDESHLTNTLYVLVFAIGDALLQVCLAHDRCA